MAKSSQAPSGLTSVTVTGYKSLAREQTVELRPLTLLAGANSSGKSSLMQPLLLLKQTLEAQYDPGALLLNGPSVKFSSADQLFTRSVGAQQASKFKIGINTASGASAEIQFARDAVEVIKVDSTSIKIDREHGYNLTPEMTHEDIRAIVQTRPQFGWVKNLLKVNHQELSVIRIRSFLQIAFKFPAEPVNSFSPIGEQGYAQVRTAIQDVIHLPGLRGNPTREYPITAVGKAFPGTFEIYTASIIASWRTGTDRQRLKDLNADLQLLGLTWKVEAHKVNDTQVELLIGRLPKSARGGARDMVSIADVGFGVSQALPAIVALHAAQPGQLVFLEQPEIHLHPRAQAAMATVLARAARRGVRVVVETHSSLLLLGIQTLVAQGEEISSEEVKLHWFQRDSKDGTTTITSRDLDETGAFGDWPEDFDEVMLQTQNRYLDAAETRLVHPEQVVAYDE